jgi:hypothetical protein
MMGMMAVVIYLLSVDEKEACGDRAASTLRAAVFLEHAAWSKIAAVHPRQA